MKVAFNYAPERAQKRVNISCSKFSITVYPSPKDSVFFCFSQKARQVLPEEDLAFFALTGYIRTKQIPHLSLINLYLSKKHGTNVKNFACGAGNSNGKILVIRIISETKIKSC